MNAWECGSERKLVRWVVRLSTWESEEKRRRSRKEEKRKWGKCRRHSNTHTHTKAERGTHTFHSRASSFVRSFVRSSPAVVVARAGWPSLPPPACSGTLITRLHGTCAVPCFSRSHPRVPIKINAFFSFFCPWLLVASIHPSVRPSVQPALVVVQLCCETQTLTLPS